MRYIKFYKFLFSSFVFFLSSSLVLAAPVDFQSYSMTDREGWMIVLLIVGLAFYQLMRGHHKSSRNFIGPKKKIAKIEIPEPIGEQTIH